MIWLADLLWIFVTTTIGVSILGLITGFSPTLHIAQLSSAIKKQRSAAYTGALIGGVLLAVIALSILFQAISLDTLTQVIESTVSALVISTALNGFFGILLIVGGFWYLHRRNGSDLTLVRPKKPLKTSGLVGMIVLGFVRTITSISSVTATFIAGNLISSAGYQLTDRLIYTAVFLAATMAPFVAMLIALRHRPEQLKQLSSKIRLFLRKIDHQLIVGSSAVIFGGAIIIFNITIALLY